MNDLTARLTELIDAAPAWAVYLIACGVVYLETAVAVIGLVAPSEAALIAAGVVAAVGKPSIAVLVVGCAVAAFCGDATGYWVGRLAGPRFSRSSFGRRSRVAPTEPDIGRLRRATPSSRSRPPAGSVTCDR